MAELEKKIGIDVVANTDKANKEVHSFKKKHEKQGIDIPIKVDLSDVTKALNSLQGMLGHIKDSFNGDFKFSKLQKEIDNISKKTNQLINETKKGLSYINVNPLGLEEMKKDISIMTKNIESLNGAKISYESFEKLASVLKNIETLMNSIVKGMNFDAIRPSVQVQEDIASITEELENFAKAEEKINKLEKYLHKTGVNKGKQIIEWGDSEDVKALDGFISKMKEYISLGGDLSKITFKAFNAKSQTKELYSLLDVIDVLDNEGKIDLIDESEISNNVSTIKTLRNELSELNKELIEAKNRENRELNVSLDTKSIEGFTDAVKEALKTIGSLSINIPEDFSFDGLSVETLDKIIGKLDEIVETIKSIGTLLSTGIDTSNFNIKELEVNVEPKINAKEFVEKIEKQIQSSAEKVKVNVDLDVFNTNEDGNVEIINDEAITGVTTKLQDEFQKVSANFGDDLLLTIDDFKDALTKTSDIDFGNLFSSLRDALLNIVTQFQNSLQSVGLSSSQLDEAYKTLKGWNDADSYAATKANVIGGERGAFLNLKTGKISNSFFADSTGSFTDVMYKALKDLSVGVNGEISSIYDTWIHSHPFRKSINGLKAIGSDTGFSFADLDLGITKALKENIPNMLSTHNYKYTNLDLSGIAESDAQRLLEEYRKELLNAGLEEERINGVNKIVFPQDLAKKGSEFNSDKKTQILNDAMRKALTNVGLDSSRLTTGNIEDLKVDLSALQREQQEAVNWAEKLLGVLERIDSVFSGSDGILKLGISEESLSNILAKLEEIAGIIKNLSTENLNEIENKNQLVRGKFKQSKDSLSGVGYHGALMKWKDDKFDFSKAKASQLGAGMYFTDDLEAVSNFGKSQIKQLKINLEKCFVITNDYISSIDDVYKAMGQEVPKEKKTAKQVLADVRNYNRSSKDNSMSFRNNMLAMGYQGMYVGDYLANKKIDSELVVYDEKKLDKLISFTNEEFTKLQNGAVIDLNDDLEKTKINVSPNVDAVEFITEIESQLRACGKKINIDIKPNLDSLNDFLKDENIKSAISNWSKSLSDSIDLALQDNQPFSVLEKAANKVLEDTNDLKNKMTEFVNQSPYEIRIDLNTFDFKWEYDDIKNKIEELINKDIVINIKGLLDETTFGIPISGDGSKEKRERDIKDLDYILSVVKKFPDIFEYIKSYGSDLFDKSNSEGKYWVNEIEKLGFSIELLTSALKNTGFVDNDLKPTFSIPDSGAQHSLGVVGQNYVLLGRDYGQPATLEGTRLKQAKIDELADIGVNIARIVLLRAQDEVYDSNTREFFEVQERKPGKNHRDVYESFSNMTKDQMVTLLRDMKDIFSKDLGIELFGDNLLFDEKTGITTPIDLLTLDQYPWMNVNNLDDFVNGLARSVEQHFGDYDLRGKLKEAQKIVENEDFVRTPVSSDNNKGVGIGLNPILEGFVGKVQSQLDSSSPVNIKVEPKIDDDEFVNKVQSGIDNIFQSKEFVSPFDGQIFDTKESLLSEFPDIKKFANLTAEEYNQAFEEVRFSATNGMFGFDDSEDVKNQINKIFKNIPELKYFLPEIDDNVQLDDEYFRKYYDTIRDLKIAMESDGQDVGQFIKNNVNQLNKGFEGLNPKEAPKIKISPEIDKSFASEVQNTINKEIADVNSDTAGISYESDQIEKLEQKLVEVATAVNNKTNAFKEEEQIVDAVIQNEVSSIEHLDNKLLEIISTIERIKTEFSTLDFQNLNQNVDSENGISILLSDLDTKIKNLDIASLKDFTDVLTNFEVKKETAENLELVAIALEEFKTSFSGFSENDNAFLNSINTLLSRTKELENLAKILESSSRKIKRAGEATNSKSDINIESVIKKDVDRLGSTLKESFKKDTGIENFQNALKQIVSDYNKLIELQNKGSVSDESLKSISRYFDAFKTELSNQLKIDTSDKPAEFIEQLKQAESQLELVKVAIDKVQRGEAFTEEDITNVKKYIEQVRELESNTNKLANASKVQNLLGKIAEILNKNTIMSKELRQEFEALSVKIKSFGNDLPVEEFSKFWQEFKTLETQMKESGQTGLSFFDGVIKRARSMSQSFISMYLSLWDIVRYVRTGLTYIKDLDTALTEMRKVSDETVLSLRNFQKASFDIASAVGTTAQQIQNSTADWMRLGESLQEATRSAEVSNILLNVSEFESIDEATESLVAMSAAYDELDKMTIIDKLNQVGNNFSISTDGLATALQRSASALRTAGNDMDEAVALVTAGNAVVQDADSVGAGLRTIALRISGTEAAKAELEELGEDVDDFVVQTSAKSQQAIKDFTKVASNNFEGFDILDDNGNFKSTYDILLGISEIYEEIVETDRQYGSNMANGLLETLAGKNRANIAASILQNPQILKDVYASSKSSEGSAQQELDKYLDSIEGKIALFQNRVQEFWYNLIDSEVVKQIVDAGIELINIFDNIVSGLTDSGAPNFIIGFVTELIGLISKLSDGLGVLNTVIAGFGIAKIKNIFSKDKNSGGRDKKFSLVIKYATESFSLEVCEFWCISEW